MPSGSGVPIAVIGSAGASARVSDTAGRVGSGGAKHGERGARLGHVQAAYILRNYLSVFIMYLFYSRCVYFLVYKY
jgi:hypothetical protein